MVATLLTLDELIGGFNSVQPRSPRGGSSGGGGGGGGGGGKSKTGSSGSSSSGSSGSSIKSGGKRVRVQLPVWAIVIIVIGSILAVAFITALLYYYLRELERDGPVRHKRVWWKAFSVVSFIWIVKRCAARRRRKKHAQGTSRSTTAGAYARIEEGAGQQPDGNNAVPRATEAHGNAPVGKYEPYKTVA